jgi:hypothetical protein
MLQHNDETDESRVHTMCVLVVRVFFLYVAPLYLACFLSLSYFVKYASTGVKPTSNATLFSEVSSLITDLENGRKDAFDAARALFTGKPYGFATEPKEVQPTPHSPQTIAQLLLKISVVVCISILWFTTFLIANDIKNVWERSWERQRYLWIPGVPWIPWVPPLFKTILISASLLPAIPFVLSMRDAYEPAVFVMALVAIFMATEHYGGLQESRRELEEQTTEIAGQIGAVLNADGLAQWRAEIYGLYKAAHRRVDAVIRYFDIDADWWLCAGSDDPWAKYVKFSKGNPDSLLDALDASKANIQFICDFPMPIDESQSSSETQRADYFRKLLGMAFNLVVFEQVRRDRRPKSEPGKPEPSPFFPYARVIISHAPSWMHVIDDIVYQVIERGSAQDSTVRRLTHGAIDPDARFDMSEWARRNVRQFAHRGGRAEEYICAVLRYQAIKLYRDEDAKLNRATLKAILDGLGMKDFLNLPNPEFKVLGNGESMHGPNTSGKPPLMFRHEAEDLCTSVFLQLLTFRMSPEVLGVSVVRQVDLTVRNLIYEVM